MKANDLVRLIDKLVEKRVDAIRKSLKEEMSSELNRTMGKILVEVLKDRRNSSQPQTIQESESVSPIHTSNPKLNSVLAETARNFTPLRKSPGGSLAELLDGGFDKIGTDEDVSYEGAPHQKSQPVDNTNVGFLKSIVSETVVPQQRSVLDSTEVPDILKGVFKKDFRAVMKKIDEQKKNGTSGLINPQSVLSG